MTTTTETSKTIALRYFEAGNRDDLAAWDEICDPNMVLIPGFMEPIEGLEAIRQFTAGMHAAFSNFYLRIEDAIAEGERVAVRHTTGGTHSAPLLGPGGPIPPTGKEMAMTGISIVRVVNGKIVEENVLVDLLGAMQQLGVIPSPA